MSSALPDIRIIDIVETPLELLGPAGRPGILGSVVIQNRITDLLDVGETIRLLDPDNVTGSMSLARGMS